MKNKLLLLITLFSFAICLFSQTESEPIRIEKYIKKEKGKYGLWNKDEKKWIISPNYIKITGIVFKINTYRNVDGVFFKLINNNNTYDLLRVNSVNFKNEFEIWIKNISEIKLPELKDDFSSRDWLNFIYYKQEGKWGWFAKKVSVLRWHNFSEETNILYPANFDNPPLLTKYGNRHFYDISFNNHILKVDSANLTGLYSLDGTMLVKPGKYSNFELPESIDYKEEIYIVLEGENQLKGYSINGVVVSPAYTSIKKVRSQILFNLDYYDCILPNGEHELRQKTVLFEKSYLEKLENDEIKRRDESILAAKKRKEEEAKKEVEGVIQNSVQLSPFDVVKIIRQGTTNDLIRYCKKFNLEFNSKDSIGMTSYIAKLPFVNGVKSIKDHYKEGLIVDYYFKDTEDKRKFMEMLKVEGFQVIDLDEAIGHLKNNGVKIWFIMGQNKWMISRSQ
jgi:hypothetical protein